jgi:hypothetical protein
MTSLFDMSFSKRYAFKRSHICWSMHHLPCIFLIGNPLAWNYWFQQPPTNQRFSFFRKVNSNIVSWNRVVLLHGTYLIQCSILVDATCCLLSSHDSFSSMPTCPSICRTSREFFFAIHECKLQIIVSVFVFLKPCKSGVHFFH